MENISRVNGKRTNTILRAANMNAMNELDNLQDRLLQLPLNNIRDTLKLGRMEIKTRAVLMDVYMRLTQASSLLPQHKKLCRLIRIFGEMHIMHMGIEWSEYRGEYVDGYDIQDRLFIKQTRFLRKQRITMDIDHGYNRCQRRLIRLENVTPEEYAYCIVRAHQARCLSLLKAGRYEELLVCKLRFIVYILEKLNGVLNPEEELRQSKELLRQLQKYGVKSLSKAYITTEQLESFYYRLKYELQKEESNELNGYTTNYTNRISR